MSLTRRAFSGLMGASAALPWLPGLKLERPQLLEPPAPSRIHRFEIDWGQIDTESYEIGHSHRYVWFPIEQTVRVIYKQDVSEYEDLDDKLFDLVGEHEFKAYNCFNKAQVECIRNIQLWPHWDPKIFTEIEIRAAFEKWDSRNMNINLVTGKVEGGEVRVGPAISQIFRLASIEIRCENFRPI